MNRRNPVIPEGINVTNEHPLKDFFFMLAGIGIAILSIIILLSILAEQLVRFIPFEVEKKLAEEFSASIKDSKPDDEQQRIQHQRIETYLQQLSDQLVIAQALPKAMSITVHYSDDELVNAFATLGGHVVIYRGLLEKMPNENALAMVLAHEIAHIKHRDPIVAMGRGITIGIALMSVMGAGDGNISQQLVGQISQLASLSFSRDQEQQADIAALQTLQQHYGHVEGASTIFEVFISEKGRLNPPAFLSTHPQSEERVEAVAAFKRQLDNNEAELNHLPPWLIKSL